jgi:HEAT repeat protein
MTTLATLFLICAPVCAPPMFSAQGERTPDAQDLAVGTVLGPRGSAVDPQSLVGLGSGAIPALFEALVAGRAAQRVDQRGSIEWIDLNAAQLGALRTSLEGQSSPALLGFLRELRDADQRRRSEALRLFGRTGEARDLPTLILLFDGGPRQRLSRSARDEFQDAFAQILARHPRSFEQVQRAFDDAPDCLLASVVWAVGSEASRERLSYLASLLGRVPDADALILNEISRQGRLLVHPLPATAAAAARRFLRSDRVELVLHAVDTSASLGDLESLPVLIELLDHVQVAVRQHALTGLQALTALGYPRDRKRWSDWYEKAVRWRSEAAPVLLARVADGSPGQAANSLLELSKWRVFRHELSTGLLAGLARPEPESVVLTCSVLGHLGSWNGVPGLCEKIDDPDPDVRRAALVALRNVTKQDLGNDSLAWRELARVQAQDRPAPAR